MITAHPVKFEIHEDGELLAIINMIDEGGSQIEIKTFSSHTSWPELSSVIQDALEMMHKESV